MGRVWKHVHDACGMQPEAMLPDQPPGIPGQRHRVARNVEHASGAGLTNGRNYPGRAGTRRVQQDFVDDLDEQRQVLHSQLVSEIADEPNYQQAIAAVKGE